MTPPLTAPASPFARLQLYRWLVVPLLAAVGLFASLWVAHPKQPAGTFDFSIAVVAKWPAFPLFTPTWVPPPTFFDVQNILWACEVDARGGDAFSEPPTMQAPYYYGYPTGWLLLGKLGFNRSDTRWLGLTWVAVFFVTALLIAGGSHRRNALWCAAGLCSPPMLECIAQANNDLTLFVLLALAAWFWHTRLWGGGPAVAFLVVASWLKLHPAVTLVALVDGTRRVLLIVVIFTVALAGLFAAQWSAIRRVSYITPRPHVHAVGHQVLPSRLLDSADRHPGVVTMFDRVGGLKLWKRALPLAVAAVLAAVLGICGWRGLKSPRPAADLTATGSFAVILFRIGALVYITAFAIGHNYMHREIFLLFCGPWLLAEPSRRWLAWGILATWWLAGVETGFLYLVGQLLTWGVFSGLAFYLARELRDDFRASLPAALQRLIPVPSPAPAGSVA